LALAERVHPVPDRPEALEARHSPLFEVISLLPVATAELHPLYSQHIFKISPEQTQRYRSF
jgi:hypothetical protein